MDQQLTCRSLKQLDDKRRLWFKEGAKRGAKRESKKEFEEDSKERSKKKRFKPEMKTSHENFT